MMKRVLSVVFAAALLVGLLAVIPVAADATSGMKISEICIQTIKEMEGFHAIPFWDYAQWTVGFGSKCPSDKLTQYQKEGIPVDEADRLMREELAKFEKNVNDFMDRTGLVLNQAQFDALVSMTYNLGSAMLYSESHRVYKAIMDGATGNELIFAFSVYCSAGGEVLPGLMRRRLVEANMYLYGEYDDYAPESYCYVLYDGNGGTKDVMAQGYDCNLAAVPMSVPTYEGYTFIGWYSAPTGGTKITSLDETTHGMTLYAHWEKGGSNTDSEELPDGGVTVTVTESAVNVRTGPGVEHAIINGVFKGDPITITHVTQLDGELWGKFEKGWISLKYTDYTLITGDTVDPEDPDETEIPEVPIKATVLSSAGVTVYRGPHTTFPKTTTLAQGAQIEILEFMEFYDVLWGRCDEGWVQVNVRLLLDDDQKLAHSTKVTIDYYYLNVRSGPGPIYSLITTLAKGTVVEILAVETYNGVLWGRCSQGWISLDYTDFDSSKLDQYRYHSYGQWYEIEASTCVDNGTQRHDCQLCTHYETRDAQLGDHTYDQWTEYRQATCVTPGEERRECVYCDAYESRETALSDHSYQDWYLFREATCTVVGEERRDCVYCDVYETRETALAEHVYGEWTLFAEADCVTPGEERRVCQNCDAYEVRETELGEHTFGQWYETVIPTAELPGEERRDCQLCDTFETRELAPTEHVYDAWYVFQEATCTEPGEERRNCLECEHYDSREIPALGHTFGEWTVTAEATCSAQGSEERTCQVCAFVETRQTETLPHSFDDWFVLTQTSCSQEGEDGRICTVCSYLEVRRNPMLSHSFGEWYLHREATCAEEGEQRRDCSVCGNYESSRIPTTEHSFSDWYVSQEATCVQEGQERRDCDVCGGYESRQLPLVAHSFDQWQESKAATCYEMGEEYRDCGVCGSSETRQTEMIPHTFGQWYEVTASTCEKTGVQRRDCENCDAFETAILPLAEHVYGAWYVYQAAGCTAPGEERRDCSVCGHYESLEIPMVAHIFGDWYEVKAATETEPGQMRSDCANCSLYLTRQTECLVAEVTRVFGIVSYYNVNIRAGAATSYEKLGTLFFGDVVEILEQTTVNGIIWGRISESAWVRITDYLRLETITEQPYRNVTRTFATITCDMLYIRSGIGAVNDTVGYLLNGDVVEIYDQVTLDGEVWGQTEKGWICLSGYATLETETKQVSNQTELLITITGTVTYDGLNVRSGAGVGYSKVGTLALGQTIHIYELTQVSGGAIWGRYDGGWTRLDGYVELEMDIQRVSASVSHEFGDWTVVQAATCTTAGIERRECATCGEYETRAVEATGHVFSEWKTLQAATCTTVGTEERVCENCQLRETRDSASSGHKFSDWQTKQAATCTEAGSEERICSSCQHQETRTVPALGHSFGAWYESKAATADQAGEERRDCASCDHYEVRQTDPLGGTVTKIYGTVTGHSYVNIRAGIGTGYALLGTLNYGDRVEILEQAQDAYGRNWGRISENGWVCLTGYLTLQTVTETVGAPSVTVTVTYGTVTQRVNIRGGVGAGYDLLGSLNAGARVEIFETKAASNGWIWGRISDNGWICLTGYVQTETVTEEVDPNEANLTMMAYESRVTIYTDTNTAASSVGYLIFGYYAEVLEYRVVDGQRWIRIQQGWVLGSQMK